MVDGSKIKLLRESAKLTTYDLAEKVFVSQPAIVKYENYIRQPDCDTLKRIANLFGVKMDDLMKDPA